MSWMDILKVRTRKDGTVIHSQKGVGNVKIRQAGPKTSVRGKKFARVGSTVEDKPKTASDNVNRNREITQMKEFNRGLEQRRNRQKTGSPEYNKIDAQIKRNIEQITQLKQQNTENFEFPQEGRPLLTGSKPQPQEQKTVPLPPTTPTKAPTKRRAIPATSAKERAYQQFRLTSAGNKLKNKSKQELSQDVKNVLKPPVEERQKQLRGPPRKFTNAQMLARSKKNQETPTEEVARRIREENEVRQRTLDRIKRGPSGSPTRQYAKTGGN